VALKDIASIFSRQFVIGFYLPAFFALLVLANVVDEKSLPHLYNHAASGTQVLIVGGFGLVVGLLLSGLHYPVLRLYEGYPLHHARERRIVRGLYAQRIKHWERVYDDLATKRAQSEPSPARTTAARDLAQKFPPRDRLLPTRFGNVIRCFEAHPRARYGLDGIAIWPRIAMSMTDQQQNLIGEAQTDVAFFINSSLVSLVVGVLLGVDAVWHGGARLYLCWIYLVPFLFAWVNYRWSIGAAIRWGDSVRAAFDLYRTDLYQKLGVKLPHDQATEMDVANRINRLLVFGEPIPDAMRE
jgi:hypothetical protein